MSAPTSTFEEDVRREMQRRAAASTAIPADQLVQISRRVEETRACSIRALGATSAQAFERRSMDAPHGFMVWVRAHLADRRAVRS
jgi:hypothetical protein